MPLWLSVLCFFGLFVLAGALGAVALVLTVPRALAAADRAEPPQR